MSIFSNLKKFVNKNEKYYPWILAGLVFFIGFVLSFFRWASQDEVTYLHDAIIIAERLLNFEWFGIYSVIFVKSIYF